MKILLISPTRNPEVKKPKGIFMPQLSLHLIAGLTPEEHEVTIIEEEVEDIDYGTEWDLVGISCMTSTAPHAYAIADEFRKRGRKVVLGGIHPTILPDEAIKHCDSIVLGEVEGVWEELLKDHQKKEMKQFYKKSNPSLTDYIPMTSLLKKRKRQFNIIPVLTTRGCPYNCEFCSVTNIYGKKIRHIPIENVVRFIEDSRAKFFMFLDDNIIGDTRYAKELFTAIKPLKIKWVGQASMSFAQREDLMKMAQDSGCFALFFGLETVSETQAAKLQKSIKEIKATEEAIKRIMDHGVHFHASLIFGFDDDTKNIFSETLDFLYRNRISTASMNVLTPYPGTQVFDRFKKQNRILSYNWLHYNHNTPVFVPKNMTAQELYEGRLNAVKDFSKIGASIQRLPFHLNNWFYHLAINMACTKSVKNEIRNLPAVAQEIYSEAPESMGNRTIYPLRSASAN